MSKAKLSGRSKRMSSFEGLHKHGGLNLVSLMDIFTILVFFLLVSSGSQQLPSSKDITLPTSVADKVPQETLIISITDSAVLVQGKKVVDIASIQDSDEILIDELVTELNFRTENRLYAQAEPTEGQAITIMGDENIPYQLLRKILASCRQTNYTKIAFAAVQTAKGKG
ncbi:ExbD/TolR family protein [Colwellia echini]|uniref:Biopolymer transporter ExbD n=1 Tax=Colwellia echini TaxID=1982103 RepID=A0ABY3MW66_9GAMM|nr:biopolymer transporter ExbD [Colwellia echini]TYK65429.1 biopolymer transporter ExbD [Colwellia echini]